MIKKTLLIIFVIVISSVIYSQQTKKENLMMDSLFEKYDLPNSPGASVAVIKDGKIIFEKRYGLADLEDNIPVKPNTNFRLASVTKQFTATAVLLLIERGKLKFDETLTDIYPNFPDYGKKITIKNLLNHTSGIIDYENLIPDSVTVQVSDNDVLKMMMKQDSTYFETGSKWQYSNTGYALLSQIVEKISGKTFPEFLKENIFDPLDMENTVAHLEGKDIVTNRAYGYDKTDSGWVRKDQSVTSAVLGDGGIYSNIKDMYKWDQSLYSDKILDDEYRNASMTRGTLNNGDKIDYGYGWRLTNYNDKEIVYHTGSTQGFRNIIYRIPSEKFTVIILTNRNEESEFVTKGLAEKVVDIYFDQN